MQRFEALRELSREHHEALVLARRARDAAAEPHSAATQAQCAHLLERWAAQFKPHFALEEQTLLPALARAGQAASAAVALQQHAALRQLVERIRGGDAHALALWGEAMDTHVRFEERALFPLAETVLGPSVLADVMDRPAIDPV